MGSYTHGGRACTRKDYLWFSSFVGGKTVGEDKNVGWEEKSGGVGGRKCGRKLWWEDIVVGEKNLLPHQIFLPPNLSPIPHFLPPIPHFSLLPHYFPPTDEENHKKILPQNRLPPHQTKKRASQFVAFWSGQMMQINIEQLQITNITQLMKCINSLDTPINQDNIATIFNLQ